MLNNLTCAESPMIRGVHNVASTTVPTLKRVAKKRMKRACNGVPEYIDFIDCFCEVVERDGFTGMWRGELWNSCQDIPTMLFHDYIRRKVTYQIKQSGQKICKVSDGCTSAKLFQMLPLFAYSYGCAMFANAFDRGFMALEVDRAFGYKKLMGLCDAMWSMVKNDGVQSLWRGSTILYFDIIVNRVAYFYLYDALKLSGSRDIENLVGGFCVTTIAGLISYPIYMIHKAQMLDYHSFGCITTGIWQEYGIEGFFKGALTKVLIDALETVVMEVVEIMILDFLEWVDFSRKVEKLRRWLGIDHESST